MRLSEKQLEAVRYCVKNRPRAVLLEGSVRSGKTVAALCAFAARVIGGGEEENYLLCAKTLTTLKRNCLEPLVFLAGEGNFSYSIHAKTASLFGRRIFLEGASDNSAENKIRGLTLKGAYCDELSLFPEDFYLMLLSRLSRENAFLIASTNPDSPFHWLKQRIDAADSEIKSFRFSIDDNPYLDPAYVAAVKSEFRGVFYDRFIRGLWVSAEGRIYPETPVIREEAALLAENHPVSVIGVDFGGNKSASVFTLTAFTQGFTQVHVIREHYDRLNQSAENLTADFEKFCRESLELMPMTRTVFCDSAEQLLIKSFRNAVARMPLSVKNAAKRPVFERIRLENALISQKRLFISPSCKNLISAFQNALWDVKKENTRLDDGTSNIDSLDSFEYTVEQYSKNLLLSRTVNS